MSDVNPSYQGACLGGGDNGLSGASKSAMNYTKFYLFLIPSYLYLSTISIMGLAYPMRYGYCAIGIAFGWFIWCSVRDTRLQVREMHLQRAVAVLTSALVLSAFSLLSYFWIGPIVLLPLTRLLFLFAMWSELFERSDFIKNCQHRDGKTSVVDSTSIFPIPHLPMIVLTAGLELNFALFSSSFFMVAALTATTILELLSGTGWGAEGLLIATPIGLTAASPLALVLLINSRRLKQRMPSKYEVPEIRLGHFV